MTQVSKNVLDVCLIGHIYAPIGMGEHVRCVHRSLKSASQRSNIKDIYDLERKNVHDVAEFSSSISEDFSEINIFHINGNEIEQVIKHVSHHRNLTGYNIIYPAWELSRYPQEWSDQFQIFSEVWAPSMFVKEAIDKVSAIPVIHMPLACEIQLSHFISRRFFGIPEQDYVFLFFFDLRSYSERKNPFAVIEAFRQLLEKRPFCNARLVIKINGAELNPGLLVKLRELTSFATERIQFFYETMLDNEVKNLVRCCDCFISLHRSEGYGRGIAEAMTLGKAVIATGYSGNMDFMATTENVAFNVNYELVPVIEGQYPHYENQVWAEPEITHAVSYMVKLIDNPRIGYELGSRAQRHMALNFSYSATGSNYVKRLQTIHKGLL